MISPTIVIGVPGWGLLSTPAATVVLVHGWAGLVPSFAIGLSYDPFSTAISGWRIADFVGAFFGASFFSCAASVTAAAIAISTDSVLRFKCFLQKIYRKVITGGGA